MPAPCRQPYHQLGVRDRHQQDAITRRERLRRKRNRDEQDQAERDRINLELGGVTPKTVDVS
jgi:hypothetical protein